MKKLIIVLTLMFVTTLALASCGEGNSSTRATREDLVGVWVVDSGSGRGTTLSLNDDGTGRRGGFPGETFDWSMSGTTLRINRRNAPAREESNERWRFTIEGDVLRLESRQQTGLTRTHFRDGALGEPDPAIIGIWAWNTNAYWEYQFDADGSGRRGEHGSFTAFTWGVTDETLRIRLNSTPNVAGVLRNESWRFTIGSGDNGETLRLESMNNNNSFGYTRDMVLGQPVPELAGRWISDDNPDWRYVFDEDGSGTRGIPGGFVTGVGPTRAELYRFRWGVHNGELRILAQPTSEITQVIPRDVASLERWSFDIDDNALQLQSLQNNDLVFNYTLAE